MLNEWNKLIKEVQNDCEQLMRLILEMVKQNQDVGYLTFKKEK